MLLEKPHMWSELRVAGSSLSAVASRGKGMLGLYLAEPLLARSGRSGKHLRLWGLRASLQGRC